MPSEELRVDGLCATYRNALVLDRVSLTIEAGTTLVLLGPNGAGKSTLLRCIAGLEQVTAGTIELGGRNVTRTPAYRRQIGLVPQEPSLFPHRTVAENIAFGPAIRRLPRTTVDAEVRAQADRLGIAGLLRRFPSQLSGGEGQRVALARALAARPQALLLDEPFANLDPEFRSELRAEFRSIFQETGIPVLHVTHDREEGLFLADRAVLLFAGRIRQSGTPSELVTRPSDPESARFLGFNVLRSDTGWLAVRPEELSIVEPDRGVPAIVLSSGLVGAAESVHLKLPDGARIESRRPPGATPVRSGATVGLRWERAVPLDAPPGREGATGRAASPGRA